MRPRRRPPPASGHGPRGPERAQAYAGFGERFRAAVSEAQFIAILRELERTLGHLTDVRVLDQSASPALTTVVLAAFYEQGTRRYEVSLDAEGVVQFGPSSKTNPAARGRPTTTSPNGRTFSLPGGPGT